MIKAFINKRHLSRSNSEFLVRSEDDEWGILVDPKSLREGLADGRILSSCLANLDYVEYDDDIN